MSSKPPPSMNHIYDYLIIGAGISGLQSLEILSKKTKNVLVLQSQSYQGGRVLSESITSLPGADKVKWVQENYDVLKNVYVQKGATWIQQRHKCLLQICSKFGLVLREQNTQGDNLYLFGNKSMTNKELLKDQSFGPSLKEFVYKIDHLSKIYDRQVLSQNKDKGRANRMLSTYDQKFVSEYLEQNIVSLEARELVDNFLEHTQCVSCEENSMHQVLTKNARSNDVGILRQFLGDFGHEASYLLNQGASKIIEKITEEVQRIRGEPRENFIYHNEQAITIDNKRPDFCIVTTVNYKTNKSSYFIGRKVICTIPLAVSRSLTFTNISRSKRFIFDNQLRTSCMKSFLIVKKPFWRPHASGDGMFSSQHLVNMCHDISPPDLSCGILVFFHNGKKFMEWESRFKTQEDEFEAKKQYIIDLTCKLFNIDEEKKAEYLQGALFYISTFMDNPNIRSGFQSCTSPGTFSTLVRLGDGIDAYYRDENNVIFIGSEYSKDYASYMEGAIRVAREKCFNLIGEPDELMSPKKIIVRKGENQEEQVVQLKYHNDTNDRKFSQSESIKSTQPNDLASKPRKDTIQNENQIKSIEIAFKN